MVLNFQTSQIRVSKFPNVSINCNLLGFAVKSYQNSQNTPHFFKEKKNCLNLGIGQNLTEFEKIPMPESLKFFINFF